MRVIRPVLALASAATLVASVLAATPASAAPTTNVARSCAKPTKVHVMACFALRRTDPDASANAVSPTRRRPASDRPACRAPTC